MRSVRIAILVCLSASGVAAMAVVQRGAGTTRPPSANAPAEATSRIVAAAVALTAMLDESGRAKLQFPFAGPQRTKWSNLPSGIFRREGLRLGDLSAAQRSAVMNLLAAALSPAGYRKVVDIMRGDEVLRRNQSTGGGRNAAPNAGRGRGGPAGPGGGVTFGDDEYYLAFLGTPSVTVPWMLQFGGHHLAINLTLAGSQAAMVPSLPAAQPATYTFEGRTVRPLGNENDKAFALINALDDTQRHQAILGYRVADLVLGPGQDGRTIQPEGIRASALSPSQQTMMWSIAEEWAGIMNTVFAEPRMAEIRSNLRDTYFAWSGPTTNGSPAYFRIQGPTLLIEYAPQQDSVDHIHTIYRDPTNDYGAKFVGK